MSKLKIAAVTLLVAVLSSLLFTSLLAYPSSGETDSNEYFTDAFIVENGVARQITAGERDAFLPMANHATEPGLEVVSDMPNIVPAATTYYYVYRETSISKSLDSTRKTAISRCISGGQDGGSISYSQLESKTISGSLTAGVATGRKSVILNKINASYTSGWSATTTKTLSISLTVGKNKTARVVFTPYIAFSRGTLEYRSQSDSWSPSKLVSSTSISAATVVKVGSYADGLYALEYR